MSLKSTLLHNNSGSKPQEASDDDIKDKDAVLDEATISNSQNESESESESNNVSLSLSSTKEKMDYTRRLCFYSQVGHIDSGNTDKSPESALHIILPNGNICLGYSVGHCIDDSMDIVDGDVWLYRPQNYAPSKIFYLCLALTVIFVLDIIFILLILFDKENKMHFNLNYNGGNNTFVILYYFVLLLSIIGSCLCIWMSYLKVLCIFYCGLLTDLIFSLFWMEHHIQFIHWTLTIFSCYLLAKYLTHSFGKWNFLQSQTRLDELEQLHREGRF